MSNKENIVLIGGGGHCKSCIDVIEAENKYTIVGIIDVKENVGQRILGYDIIGLDDNIPEIIKKYKNALVTIGQILSPKNRIRIFKILEHNNATLPVIISPFADVSKHTEIASGTIIMHQALVNVGAKIGKNCIVNTKALIEHDAEIGNNCHISTNAIVNGGLVIGDNCLIGSNSVTKQYIEIASNTIIGAGAVIIDDIKESGIYIGNPAKKIG